MSPFMAYYIPHTIVEAHPGLQLGWSGDDGVFSELQLAYHGPRSVFGSNVEEMKSVPIAVWISELTKLHH